MADAKRFKVVAVEATRAGTKHRVQLEVHRLMRRRVVKMMNGKPVVSYPLEYRPVYIKNVELADVQAATIQTAARALIIEFKAQLKEPKPSIGFTPYEEQFDRA